MKNPGAELRAILCYGRQIAPEDVKVYNPAFDVTPDELIAAIVTEKEVGSL